MKWTTREEYEEALREYNNKMYHVGKIGTLQEQRVLYNTYNEVWENYKLTQGLKKFIAVSVTALILVIGALTYYLYNKDRVQEVISCGVTNSCTYKNLK